MRVAAIDLGSNSFLCLVAEQDKGGGLKEIYDTIEYVKLGEGVHQNKSFSESALKRAEDAFVKFADIIQKYDVEKVVSVATSAARDVTNRERFFDLGRKYNIPIDIISGEREGEYTYLGVLSGRPDRPNFCVIDIGGGSTEFAYMSGGHLQAASFNIGCVRLTELFLHSDPETDEEILNFKTYLKEHLRNIDTGNLELVGVAGTPTTLASLCLEKDFNPGLIDNYELTDTQIENLILKLNKLTIEKRRLLKGIDAPRADVIMAGALILEHVLKECRLNKVTVSSRGVRYGLALKTLMADS